MLRRTRGSRPRRTRRRTRRRRQLRRAADPFFKDEGVARAARRRDAATAAPSSSRAADRATPKRTAGAAADQHRRRALRPDRAHAREEHAGHDRAGHQEHVPRTTPMSFNVVGEIPGTDKADEVVMLGAHFDSWHGGTGATDNAAGSAVMMEAMRILKQSGVKLRRTVRIGLWGGEEQGLIGSREYVHRRTSRDRADMIAQAGAREASPATSTSTTAPARSAASTCRGTRPSRRSSRPGWSRSTTSA